MFRRLITKLLISWERTKNEIEKDRDIFRSAKKAYRDYIEMVVLGNTAPTVYIHQTYLTEVIQILEKKYKIKSTIRENAYFGSYVVLNEK